MGIKGWLGIAGVLTTLGAASPAMAREYRGDWGRPVYAPARSIRNGRSGYGYGYGVYQPGYRDFGRFRRGPERMRWHRFEHRRFGW